MHIFKRASGPCLIALVILSSLACGGQTLIPSFPTFPPMPPTPSTSDVSIGSSPMSGDWNAKTKFGRLAFSVNPDGTNLTTAVVVLSNFTCGGTTLTTNVQTLGPFPLDQGQFSIQVDLESDEILYMNFDGTYNAKQKVFSGSWEEDAHGDHCSGTWESTPHR